LQLDEILKRTVVSYDDPALLIDWDEEALSIFATSCNNNLSTGLFARCPPWITSQAGTMSARSFAHDFVRYLATCAGGSAGRVFVGPNTAGQFLAVGAKLREAETHPFVQQHAASLPGGTN
jgi:hypothetical protein